MKTIFILLFFVSCVEHYSPSPIAPSPAQPIDTAPTDVVFYPHEDINEVISTEPIKLDEVVIEVPVVKEEEVVHVSEPIKEEIQTEPVVVIAPPSVEVSPEIEEEVKEEVQEEITAPEVIEPVLEEEHEELPSPSETEVIVASNPNVLPLLSNEQINSQVMEYVKTFVFYANLFSKPIAINSLDVVVADNYVSRPYLAYCQKIKNNTVPQIVINQSYWNRLNSSYREQLLFHEMGHCMLGRTHKGASWENPSSIMNEFLIPETLYKANYEYFLKELFSSKDSSGHETLVYGYFYK